MQILRVENLAQAVRYARQCQDEGEFDLFRGQVERWPMVPTFLRLPEQRQEAADEQVGRFFRWIDGNPDVAAMLPTAQSRFAVAQHYGIPTSLLDVTSDPRIAGFFASHTSRPPARGTESCIYCFHAERMRAVTSALHAKALEDGFSHEEIELPAHFGVDVSNLWRLQAQFGSFILAPDWVARDPEARLLEQLFEATCLVFPYSGPLAEVEERLVYPERKSALEIRLDEWFAQEAVAEHQRAARAAGHTVIDAHEAESMLREMNLDQLGFKPEVASLLRGQLDEPQRSVFDETMDPGPEPSWSDSDMMAGWLAQVDERFHDAFTDEQWTIVAADVEELDALEAACMEQVHALRSGDPSARARTMRWQLVDASGAEVSAPGDGEGGFDDPERTRAGDWLALAWDGMRALPFDDEEVAIALGRIAAALSWVARGRTPWTLESPLYLDLVMAMRFDPVVVIPEAAFAWALRYDLRMLLHENHAALADDPRQLLLAVNDPRFLFDFGRWRRIFAVYVIPSQVVMGAQNGFSAAIYNPTLPVAVRPH